MNKSDQLVIDIVQSVLGRMDRFNSDHIAQAARLLAQPPNGRQSLGLSIFCREFLAAYRNWNYDWVGNGEQWLLKTLATFSPSLVFDVGANVGNWLGLAREALPASQLHAFEIVESTHAILSERMAGKPNITVNNFGLSDRTGTMTMHLFDASSELTSHVAYPHGSYREIESRVRRGDEYASDNSIERIDLLKIDVEGAEHLVLNGFDSMLARGMIDVIQFEYGKVNIITHFLLRDFYEFLGGRGYSLGKLFPDHVDFRPYELEDEDFLGPNYVAVRKARTDIVGALSRR